MKKVKSLSKKEIEERKKAVRSAEIMASLDNNSNYPEGYLEAREKWINGEISDEELENIAFGR